MRTWAFALLAIAPAAIVWLSLSGDRAPPQVRAASNEDPLARARIERLEAEVEGLRGDVERARADAASLRGALLATAPPQGPEGQGVDAYLDEYVRSFMGNGRGSEYFRLVVDAYAPALKESILRKIADPAVPVALRENLIAILGRAEFKGDGQVIAALVGVLRAEPQLAPPVVQALRVIGDARTGLTLEALVFDLGAPAKALALQAAVELSAEANATIARLLATAPDTATRQLLLNLLLVGGDDAPAVHAFREASRMEQPVRLFAATKLGTFRGDPFRRLVEEWLGYETDPQVQAVLRKARDQQSGIPNWHALKATGPPDAEPATNDHPNAWATREQDKGREWLELTYDPPRRASGVRIFEVNVPGGVVEIETVDDGGTRRSVWRGADPMSVPGVFEVPFVTSYRVKAVRIILDTSKRNGWEEIDAVELLGPEGRAWATGASASSSYGQG